MKKQIKSKDMWKMLQQHHDEMMLEKKQFDLKGKFRWDKFYKCWYLEVKSTTRQTQIMGAFEPNSKLIRTLKPKKPRTKVEIIVRCEE